MKYVHKLLQNVISHMGHILFVMGTYYSYKCQQHFWTCIERTDMEPVSREVFQRQILRTRNKCVWGGELFSYCNWVRKLRKQEHENIIFTALYALLYLKPTWRLYTRHRSLIKSFSNSKASWKNVTHLHCQNGTLIPKYFLFYVCRFH